MVRDYYVVVRITSNALRSVETAVGFARLAEAKSAHVTAVATAKHLHAVIIVVTNYYMATVDGDANRVVELPG